MNTAENKSERELAEHIEKLIAAVRGMKIPEAWFKLKNGNNETFRKPTASTVSQAMRIGMQGEAWIGLR